MGIKSNNPATYFFDVFSASGHDAGNPSVPVPIDATGILFSFNI